MRKKVLAVMMSAMMGTMMMGMAVQASEEPEAVTVGISQFAEHGSLDNCREGFLQGLEEAGYVEGENLTVIYENAQSDTGTAATISDSFVSQGVDLVCAIATPTAMSAYNSCMDTEIPVIYTAVSDPLSAGLIDEEGANVGNITGTCDQLPVKEQLEMIRELMPDAKTVGILYTTSEANSISTIETYKELAGDYGFEIVDTGISTIADVELAVQDLAGKVDCISNLTDNTVVSALQTVLAAANDAGIPVFGSEIEQVRNGCMAAMGLDYVQLGRQTGAMAAKVLKGEATAEELPYETIEGASLYVNTEAASNLGYEFSEETLDSAEEIFDTIEVQ
ncbi:MAG TPA: ABC transporter substrate-binding protein [Candidatus Limivivens merdigallinarum]|uniref:ABC transporter substrate-binding protein n=1 Tax=Candidatus Limivivens merdigallinarum TaxID=2840859 RepID=A0A9D0ZWV5_9FIRM|nr:ABC transporter substrate-binding protein [Candidatus Limivivens merdigallinarum]